MKPLHLQLTLPFDVFTKQEKSPYNAPVRHLGEISHSIMGQFDISFTNEQIPKIRVAQTLTGRHGYIHIQGMLEAACRQLVNSDA